MIHTHKSEEQALLRPPKRDATKMTTCLVVTSITTRIQSCSCLLVQHVGGGDSSSRQSLQAADPARELMDRLQAELEPRLSKNRNNANAVGLVDEVKLQYKTKEVLDLINI